MREPGGKPGYQKAMTRRIKSPGPRRALAACALVSSVTGLVPAAAAAQDDDEVLTVTLEGEVLDVATGLPVQAAIVAVPGVGLSAVSDELGYFQLEEIPAGVHGVQVLRLGYETLTAEVPVDGGEVLALYLTPGPISLEGIEIEVTDREDIAWRAAGTSMRGLIGPVEMEDLRQRYFNLGDVLRTRHLPRTRFLPGRFPGDTGCLMVTSLSLSGRSCAAVVVDGVLLGSEWSGWVYEMNTHDIFAVRFVQGPAAALRYGHRGGDGVLIIETRVGR